MGLLGRVGDPAGDLFHMEQFTRSVIEGVEVILPLGDRFGNMRKERDRCVPVLTLAPGEVDRFGQQAAGCSRLEPADLKTKVLQIVAQRGDAISHATPLLSLETYVEKPPHESPSRHNHAPGREPKAYVGFGARNLIALDREGCDVGLLEGEIGKILQKRFDTELIGLLVTLGTRSPNTRTFGCIEHPKLDSRGIRVESHDPAECINLPNEVTFSQSSNGWVARHLTDRIGILCQQKRLGTHRGSCMGGLDTGMTGTNHKDIKLFRIEKHRCCSTWNNLQVSYLELLINILWDFLPSDKFGELFVKRLEKSVCDP